MAYKPMRAVDVVEENIKYPCAVLPKIDGVRGVNPEGTLLSRTLKPFANKHMMSVFSRFQGFDGEFACGNDYDDDLCRKTTSAVTTIEGEPVLKWHIFDICDVNVAHMGYVDRYNMARDYLRQQHEQGEFLDLQIVPMQVINNHEELLYWENIWLDMGYEGVIGRSLERAYKHGTATMREGGYWRLKRFVEEDAVVNSIIEGQTNENELVLNELGYASRSSHQENMVPNGMVGSMLCTDVKTGKEITVGAGKLTHDQRKAFFDNPSLIIGQTIKYKHFPRGVKDKNRFPTYQSHRADVDKMDP